MKKYSFIIAALFAVAAVSCQKEIASPEKAPESQDQPQAGEGDITVFTVSAPAEVVSKTVIGAPDGSGKYTPLWTETDEIIDNGVASAKAEILNGGTSARFSVAGVTAPYLALAPGHKIVDDAYSYDPANNAYNHLVPGAARAQRYTLNGSNPSFDPIRGTAIAAYSTTEALTFHHLYVYYKITVDAAGSTDSDNIRYVYIRQGDGSMLAGTWTVNYVDENNITTEPKSLSSVVALDCGEEGIPQGTPMIVAVPAYNYSNGLIITIKDINGHFCSYTMKPTATQFAASAGTIYDFEPAFAPGPGTINSAEDWEAFALALNSGKDFQLYRWVGNGTVKLGADITATTLTRINAKFPYTFDGQGHTITRSAATSALFRNVRGTVKNLNLSGSVSSGASYSSALADTLYSGGRIEYCNNAASVTINATTYGIAGGIAAIATGGTINHCNNSGAISVSVDCSTATQYNLQAAGIVAQVNTTITSGPTGHLVIEFCNNSGAILGNPVCSDSQYGITYAAVGGITAWLRGTAKGYTIDHCENTGNITYSGELVSSAGMAYNAVFAGGIAGIASDMNNGYLRYNTGLDVTISNCTNLGQVHNCGINVSTGTQNLRHVYTGGIAGSCVGTTSKHASIISCKNKGKLLTYDLTGDSTYAYPEYSQVVGGIVGFGGFLDIDNCIVNCTIGNGKRACNSIGGAIGHAIRAFSVSNCKIWYTMYFTRINSVNHINTATVAVAPMKYGTSSNSTPIDLTGSTVSNNALKGNGFYYNTTTGSTADDSAKCTNEFSISNSNSNMVRGNPTSGNTEPAKVTFSGNTALTEEPQD